MLETMKYFRKPFYIDAVQVTADNLAAVASWVNGEVRIDKDKARYVKVRVHRPLDDRQTKAFLGDWVLYAGTGFKVYTPKAFANSFEQHSAVTTVHDDEDKSVDSKKQSKKAVPTPPFIEAATR